MRKNAARRLRVDGERHDSDELAGIVHEKKQGRQNLLKAAAGGQSPLVSEKHLGIVHGEDEGVPSLREVGIFRNFLENGYEHRFSGFSYPVDRRAGVQGCRILAGDATAIRF